MRLHHLTLPEFRTSAELRMCSKCLPQDAAGASQGCPCWCHFVPARLQSTDSCCGVPADCNPQYHFGISVCNFWSEKLLLCPVNPLTAFGLCCFLRWVTSPLLGQGTELFSLSQHPEIFYQVLSWCCSPDLRTKESECFPLREGLKSWPTITKVVPNCPDDAWLSCSSRHRFLTLHSSV